VVGEMPTMPGFDPGRALARPTGEFVFLRDARICLADQPDAGEATAPRLLVNRYTVDRVKADLMLGFFFPGAEMVLTGAAAAQPAQAAATSVQPTTTDAVAPAPSAPAPSAPPEPTPPAETAPPAA
jgi:hypothetical protein